MIGRFLMSMIALGAVALASDAGAEFAYRIAYAAAPAGNPLQIFTMNPDGLGKSQLTNAPFLHRDPSWSPDMQMIAFISSRSGDNDLFVMKANGSGVKNITDTPDLWEWGPAWSPNGREIAYYVRRALDLTGEIWIVDVETGRKRRITTAYVPGISWSPDGRRLAFLRLIGKSYDVFLIDLQTGREENLTGSPSSERSPCFTPDGDRLLFISDEGGRAGIYELDLRSREVKRIFTSADITPVKLTVSPDGRWIFFHGVRGPKDSGDIYRVDLRGRKLLNLTASPGVVEMCPSCPPPSTSFGIGPQNALPSLWGMLKISAEGR